MATPITITGNLTNDPELRFTPGGDAVASFTVAQTERVFNRDTSKWEDGNTNFWRCSAWKAMAENVAESLTKGAGVVITGTVRTRNYETKEGEKRSAQEVRVEDIGVSLRWATAKPVRNGGGSQPGRTSATQGFAGVGGNVAGQGGGWGGDGGWGGQQQGGGWDQQGPAY
jgi:single-strand DNA-binding protein